MMEPPPGRRRCAKVAGMRKHPLPQVKAQQCPLTAAIAPRISRKERIPPSGCLTLMPGRSSTEDGRVDEKQPHLTQEIGSKVQLTLVVRVEGLEPPRLAAPEPKSGASTNFATPAPAQRTPPVAVSGSIANQPPRIERKSAPRRAPKKAATNQGNRNMMVEKEHQAIERASHDTERGRTGRRPHAVGPVACWTRSVERICVRHIHPDRGWIH